MSRAARRSGRVVMAALAVAASVVACSGGGGGASTVTWYVNKTPSLTTAVYESVAAKYEATHPGVDVAVVDQGGQNYDSYFRTLLSSGNAPDIGAGVNLTPDLAKNFVDLTGQDWVAPLTRQSYVQQTEVDGKVYTVPLGYQVKSLIFYNKTAWAKAGITATPTTVAGLTDAMAKLKAVGVAPFASSGDWVTGSQANGMAWPSVAQSNGTWYADRAAGKVTYAGSPWQDFLGAYQGWVDAGYIAKDVLGMKYDQAQSAFLAGKYGMWQMGSWFVASAASTPHDFEIGVFATPTLTPGPTPTLGIGAAFNYLVPAAAKNKEGAIDFLKFLNTDNDAASILLKADGDYSDTVTYPLDGLGAQVLDLARAVPSSAKFLDSAASPYQPSGFSTKFGAAVQTLYSGTPAATVASDLDTQWNILAKG